ncbi:hypothetical protein [Mucilaginibacter sp.]
MKEASNPAMQRALYVFGFAIFFIMGLGVYCNLTNTSTGGTLYSRYGGNGATVRYGDNEMFIIAGILLLGALVMMITNKLRA